MQNGGEVFWERYGVYIRKEGYLLKITIISLTAKNLSKNSQPTYHKIGITVTDPRIL
jgi:hypothetical protein